MTGVPPIDDPSSVLSGRTDEEGSTHRMDHLDALLDRNRAFARTDAKERVPAIPFHPNRGLYIVACIDPRVDPGDLLGLELGDAIVARSVGGRITDAILEDISYIAHLVGTKTPDGPWFEVAVMHHTDCGSQFLADPAFRAGFEAATGYEDEERLAATPVVHPEATVRHDVARVRDAAQVPPEVRVSGHVYDVATGLVTTVEHAR